MDPTKVQTVLDWQTPWSICDVQCFLGFAVCTTNSLWNTQIWFCLLWFFTQKNRPFTWTLDTIEAFESLKHAFTSYLFLIHDDPTKPFALLANMSNFVFGRIILTTRSNHFPFMENRSCWNRILDSCQGALGHCRFFLALCDLLYVSPHQIIIYSDNKNLAARVFPKSSSLQSTTTSLGAMSYLF